MRKAAAVSSKPRGTAVAGVTITHPDRRVYPAAEISKLDLARFYERIAPWILPHLTGRPLTLVRCPEGSTLSLDSFPKTTGGRGLHVVVPLVPHADWRTCLEFSRSLASAIERHDSRRYTTAFAKAGRERKILIDYLRNNRTNTSVAAYSTRARDGAPVSTPLGWTELGATLDPAAFTVRTIEARLKRRRDPWAGYWTTKQRLSAAALKALKAMAAR